MRTIHITDALSNSCLLASELGNRLLELLQKELKDCEAIELDFAGYKYLSKEFLKESLGILCSINGWETKTFEEKIHVINMDDDDREELEVVLNDVQMNMKLKD